MAPEKTFPTRDFRVPLVDMAVDRSRNCGKRSHCARVATTSRLLIHVEDRIRCATNAGYPVGVWRGVAGLRRRALVGALALVLVSACSSSDGAVSTTTASTSTTDVATTTTVTQPSSTSTSTSTATAPPASTQQATTIADPVALAEGDVGAALDLAQSSFSDCLTAMPICDPTTLGIARAGDLLERNIGRIEEWNAAGYTVVDRDQFRYVIESVTLSDDLMTATVVVCIADGSKLVLPGAAPDGGDVIIDDAYTSGRSQWDMRLDGDGHWRGYDAPAVGPTEATDQCPA